MYTVQVSLVIMRICSGNYNPVGILRPVAFYLIRALKNVDLICVAGSWDIEIKYFSPSRDTVSLSKDIGLVIDVDQVLSQLEKPWEQNVD